MQEARAGDGAELLEEDACVNAAGYAGAALAGALVVARGARASAYVPLPAAGLIAARDGTRAGRGFALAAALSFGVPFAVALTRNLWLRYRRAPRRKAA